MPRFEFEFSVVLLVCAVGSGIVKWCMREKEGKIRLPTHAGEENERVGDGFAGEGGDPFDVTRPEDIVDGYSLDEDEFWKRVSLWVDGYFARVLR